MLGHTERILSCIGSRYPLELDTLESVQVNLVLEWPTSLKSDFFNS